MPELPEVETIRRDLEKALVGKRVVAATLKDARLMDTAQFVQFEKIILEQKWKALERHGKYLWASLENGWRVVFHLRMTGQLIVEKPSNEKRFRLGLLFNHSLQLNFYDQRRFGEVWLLSPEQKSHSATTPGPDALNELNVELFRDMLRGRTTKIQPLLLDQRRLAGVGNIYAQEALFKAHIRPSRAAKRISRGEASVLFDALQQTLRNAIDHRGSTSRNYRDAYGRHGSAQTLHAVYRKGGMPCPRCGGALRSVRIGGRGTVFCPRCQR